MEENPLSTQSRQEKVWLSRCYHLILFSGLLGTVAAAHQAFLIFSARNSLIGAFAQYQFLAVVPAVLICLAISCFGIAKIYQTKGKLPLTTKVISVLLLISGIALPLIPSAYVNDPVAGMSTITKGKNPESYIGESREIFEEVFGWSNSSVWSDDNGTHYLVYDNMTVYLKENKVDRIEKQNRSASD
ncbi:MAG: hypothetical protein KF836_04540 [Fimbriimonadaceae bacterium]|nr:hypothetical protein [Fimbriimonadaceae bacterium]